MAFCVDCGLENDDKNKFCTNCGKSLKKESSKATVKDDINKILDIKIEHTDKTPESVVKELETNVKNGCIEYVTDLEMDDRIKAGNIIADGLKNQRMPNETINQLQKELNISRDMAETIEQTEIMRSAHANSYREALSDGKAYYVLDNRSESCKYCQETAEGNIFDINDKENIPPLHTKCACIPVYFSNEEDAKRWAEMLKKENIDARENLTDRNGYDFIDMADARIKKINSSDCDIKNYEEILELLNMALNDNISDFTKAKAYRTIGEIYYNLGDYKEALNNFEKALELNPKVGAKRLYEKLKKF